MSDKLDFKYREMVRLAEKSDEYTKASFEDFKLLGALGALIAWKPVVELLSGKPGVDKNILLIGFLAILAVSAVIGMFGLLRQSVVNFYLHELEKFEKEIRLELDDVDTATFRVAENWRMEGRKKQRRVAVRFYGLFYLVLIAYPTAILFVDCTPLSAGIYLVSSIGIFLLHMSTTAIVHGDGQ